MQIILSIIMLPNLGTLGVNENIKEVNKAGG
jgi:hypothetical protein